MGRIQTVTTVTLLVLLGWLHGVTGKLCDCAMYIEDDAISVSSFSLERRDPPLASLQSGENGEVMLARYKNMTDPCRWRVHGVIKLTDTGTEYIDSLVVRYGQPQNLNKMQQFKHHIIMQGDGTVAIRKKSRSVIVDTPWSDDEDYMEVKDMAGFICWVNSQKCGLHVTFMAGTVDITQRVAQLTTVPRDLDGKCGKCEEDVQTDDEA